LYQEKKYDQALQGYQEAEKLQPDSAYIHYNEGTAEYKNGQYAQAAESFPRAFATDDKKLEFRAAYNMGNAKYFLGESLQEQDSAAAVQALEASLQHYRRAIELNPGDQDARFNYELSERKLNALKERLKNPPAQPPPSSEKKEKESQKEEQGSSGPPQGSQPQEKKEDSSQEKNSQNEARRPGGGENNERAGSTQEEKREMSAQEAKMLLEGLRDEEMAQGELKDTPRGSIREAEKDW